VARPIEVVFVLLLLAGFAYALRITEHVYFYADDWLVIPQSWTFAGFLRPYNNSLSLISVASDRLLTSVFGFTYRPFMVVSLAALFLVPASYFFTTRRQFGTALAAFFALPLLWYGSHISLLPTVLNHNLALVGGIFCAAALNRGKRADIVLAAALALSLCAAGGGVAVAGACIVHCLCTRPHLRRWIAIAAPLSLWIVWWLVYVRSTSDIGPYAIGPSDITVFIRDLFYAAFRNIALDNVVVAWLLLAAFVAYGIRVLISGLRNSANFVAWSIGIIFWGVGIAQSRGVFSDASAFRYRYTALGFVLLAIVPVYPISWPIRTRLETDRRALYAAAAVILVLGAARGLAVRSDLRTFGEVQNNIGLTTRGESLVIGMKPAVEPDDRKLTFAFGWSTVGDVRAVLEHYGNPLAATPQNADRRLVELGAVRMSASATRNIACRRPTQPISYRGPTDGSLVIAARDTPIDVEVRRFADSWVRLGAINSGEAKQIILPMFGVTVPWQVRVVSAANACVESRARG
jgi:hypothetical protein